LPRFNLNFANARGEAVYVTRTTLVSELLPVSTALQCATSRGLGVSYDPFTHAGLAGSKRCWEPNCEIMSHERAGVVSGLQ
jgi:hypothetical protein